MVVANADGSNARTVASRKVNSITDLPFDGTTGAERLTEGTAEIAGAAGPSSPNPRTLHFSPVGPIHPQSISVPTDGTDANRALEKLPTPSHPSRLTWKNQPDFAEFAASCEVRKSGPIFRSVRKTEPLGHRVTLVTGGLP